MSNLYSLTELERDPMQFVGIFRRAMAGIVSVIEDKETGKRITIPAATKSAYKDPWGTPPPEVVEEWKKDIAEFEEEDRKNPRPRFTSAAEMVAYMRKQK